MKKVLAGCLGVVVLGTMVVGAGLLYFIVERPTLDAALDIPATVVLKEAFELRVISTNHHDTPVTLDSIDISDDLFDGFQVISIEPRPKRRLDIFGMQSWNFGQRVQPGEDFVVTFELRPIAEGRFVGDIDVCNPSQDFQTLIADIIVKPRE